MSAVPIDYERIVQEVYEAVLDEGDTAVDVGAHAGRHTLPLARCVGEAGKVFAVEPLPACQETLRQALGQYPELSDVVHVLPFALSDRRGESPAGRPVTVIDSPSASTTARSMTFCSSRTLPGQ